MDYRHTPRPDRKVSSKLLGRSNPKQLQEQVEDLNENNNNDQDHFEAQPNQTHGDNRHQFFWFVLRC